ncbi:hypothetical protein [Streptomyces sp. UNOB3_S3]|uniref:hypothetical protein n=1 Tax=Streptomyces sp. UNOB3_S3 TaxID=2871682 RepID=UPI001E5218E0|nr:hypothetical protein [Streptomyces sp. UNOB3_S3]MCC3775293.1 hypothetical protein [Streptomyces sp. UNOB3_S3]
MSPPIRRTAVLLFATLALLGTTATAPAPPAHHEAECHTRLHGSHAVTHCFNGNATPDRVQLHVECVHWWDPGMDTAPVTVGPASHVALTQRCWLGIRRAWVTHAPG